MTLYSRPIWWRGQGGFSPTVWTDAFLTFTCDETADEWGLAAAILIARTRRRTGRGPTFADLFRELLLDGDGFPGPLAGLAYLDRWNVVREFRRHVAIEWRRRGWINWDLGVERSLRTGRVFQERSRQRRTGSRADGATLRSDFNLGAGPS